METLPPATPLDSKWYQIWMDIWFHPGDQAFRDAFKERDHGVGRAFIWLATTGLLTAVISSVMIPFFRSQFTYIPNSFIVVFICQIILAPIFAILGMVVSSLIYHVVAMIFRGKGQWSDLVFGLSAVNAPATVIGSLLAIPVVLFSRFTLLWWLVALLVGVVSVVVGVYVIIETVNAIRAAENLGVGGAIGTILVPIAVGVVLSVCCTLLLIPAFINTSR
jgi:hypothetical protein